MNRILFYLLLIPLSLSFAACSDDDEPTPPPITGEGGDYIPTSFKISVVNQQGENLLDENTPGCILDQQITASYDGDSRLLRPFEDVQSVIDALRSRVIMYDWLGVFLVNEKHVLFKDTDESLFPLLFIGELPGDKIGEFPVTLSIGNRNYTITVKLPRFDEKSYTFDREIYLDGQLVEAPGSYCKHVIIVI